MINLQKIRAARSLFVWLLVLALITSVAAAWLLATGVDPTQDFSVAIILAGYAPSLAAVIVAGFAPGAGGAGWVLRQMGIWRMSLKWYALALIGPFLLVALASLINIALGGKAPLNWLAFSELGGSIGPLIAGSLGEEIGWRGFAQPLLQKRYSILWASIIIGTIWATWHLWPAFAPGGGAELEITNLVQTYVRLISTAILYGWIYNATGGSLLLVMLAHAGHNIAIDLIPPAETEASGLGLIVALLYMAAALVVMCATKGALLARPKTSS